MDNHRQQPLTGCMAPGLRYSKESRNRLALNSFNNNDHYYYYDNNNYEIIWIHIVYNNNNNNYYYYYHNISMCQKAPNQREDESEFLHFSGKPNLRLSYFRWIVMNLVAYTTPLTLIVVSVFFIVGRDYSTTRPVWFPFKSVRRWLIGQGLPGPLRLRCVRQRTPQWHHSLTPSSTGGNRDVSIGDILCCGGHTLTTWIHTHTHTHTRTHAHTHTG